MASAAVFAGLLLVLVAAGNQISTTLKPGDADQAQSQLARVPLQTQNLKFAEPDSAAWKRLRKAWGRPEYVLTVELARNEQGCWDDFHIAVQSPVALAPMSERAFGHVNECAGRALGLRFQTAANFHITIPDHENFPPAELVILPLWPGDEKQRLGEAYIDERLSQISRWLLGGGVLLALAGAWGLRSV